MLYKYWKGHLYSLVYITFTRNISVLQDIISLHETAISFKHCCESDYIHYLQDCLITVYKYYYFKCNQRIQGKLLLKAIINSELLVASSAHYSVYVINNIICVTQGN
jgi:hypothetical protein